ncbi:hypothetical protein V6N13_083716 [Hibiscus sabdariffa]|uniref:Uncharacterized protein n=1 Tax=Hibiscus sabdariffa TaxID=183260 RepID=A0ABR2SYW7_9ROSI
MSVSKKEASTSTSACVSPSLCVLTSNVISWQSSDSVDVVGSEQNVLAGITENVVEPYNELVSDDTQNASPTVGSAIDHGDSPVGHNSGTLNDDAQSAEAISILVVGSLS